jgi:hypothetical protein
LNKSTVVNVLNARATLLASQGDVPPAVAEKFTQFIGVLEMDWQAPAEPGTPLGNAILHFWRAEKDAKAERRREGERRRASEGGSSRSTH